MKNPFESLWSFLFKRSFYGTVSHKSHDGNHSDRLCANYDYWSKRNRKLQIMIPCHCPDCCEHDDHDHGICLDCGEDITQLLVRQAERASEGYDR